MKRIKRWMAAHVVLSCLAVTLVFTGAAVAAFVLYSSTLSGQVHGSFGTATGGGAAITATDEPNSTGAPVLPCTSGTGATCTGGQPGNIPVLLTNNTSQDEAISSFSASFATGQTQCDGHLFAANTFTGMTVPANGTQQVSLLVVADPSTPASCSAAPITATLGGTTSP